MGFITLSVTDIKRVLFLLIKHICKVLIGRILAGGDGIQWESGGNQKMCDCSQSFPSLVGLSIRTEELKMQLQGAAPTECEHIMKQHGGTAKLHIMPLPFFNYTSIAFVDENKSQQLGMVHQQKGRK